MSDPNSLYLRNKIKCKYSRDNSVVSATNSLYLRNKIKCKNS